MPGIYDTPASRRKFLLTSGAMVSSLGACPSLLRGDSGDDRVRLALLSDTHIPAEESPTSGYRGFVPAENLRQVVTQVTDSGVGLAVLNGDAARSAGYREDYQVLRKLLAPVAEQIPVHIGLGNHDDRNNFFKEFPQGTDRKELVFGKHVSEFSLNGLRFVVLDSLLYVNKTAGLLGKLQRDWLENFLATPDESPIVFFVHHTLGEYDGELLDHDRMLRIMAPHKKVKAIFCGHAHTYRIEQRGHIQVIQQPAIGYNFHDSQPVGWLDATFSQEGVELTLRAVAGNREEAGRTTSVPWSV